jgi:hypothetical protein
VRLPQSVESSPRQRQIFPAQKKIGAHEGVSAFSRIPALGPVLSAARRSRRYDLDEGEFEMTKLSMGRAARAAMMTLMLAAPAVSNAAYAFDPFGGDETVVTQSARSARYGNPADTPLARATADAKPRASAMATNPAATASDASRMDGPVDLLGTDGQQDDLAREIYHPGSGTDW